METEYEADEQLGPLINPSIYNPVIDEVKSDLNATDTQIGLSLSMFILYVFLFPIHPYRDCG